MEIFTQAPSTLGSAGVLLAFPCVIGAIIGHRRGEPWRYRAVSALLIFLFSSGYSPWPLVLGPGVMLMAMGFMGDAIANPKVKRNERIYLNGFVFVLALFCLEIVPWRGSDLKITIDSHELVVISQGETSFDRKRLRLLEFRSAGEREWHLKDGENVIGFSDYSYYLNNADRDISTSDFIDRIEAWTGKERELFYGPPELALRVTR